MRMNAYIFFVLFVCLHRHIATCFAYSACLIPVADDCQLRIISGLRDDYPLNVCLGFTLYGFAVVLVRLKELCFWRLNGNL